MTATYVAWAIAAGVLVALAVALGALITHRPLGLLIDTRGRYSLTHTQLALWTITVLSLIAGVFIGRWYAGIAPFNFDIPASVLGAMGISLGSSVLSTAQKASVNTQSTTVAGGSVKAPSSTIAASVPIAGWRPNLGQIFLTERGPLADQVIDMTKFQNFIITVVVVLAYVSISIMALNSAETPSKFTGLPVISGSLLVLLAISHGAYLGGKLPTASGDTATLSVAGRSYLSANLVSTQPGVTTNVGRLWSADAVVYASGTVPPPSLPTGTALVVTGPQEFLLGVATHPSGPNAGLGVTTDIASSQVAAGQWAAVVPATTLATPGQLTLQLKSPASPGPGPVAGGSAVIQIPVN